MAWMDSEVSANRLNLLSAAGTFAAAPVSKSAPGQVEEGLE